MITLTAPTMSYFNDIRQSKPTRSISLESMYKLIRGDRDGERLKASTAACAKAIDAAVAGGCPQPKRDKAYANAKQSLPAVMISGTATGNTNDSMVTHTGMFQGDFDNLSPEQLARIRPLLDADPHVTVCWKSPSGRGLKVIVTADPPPVDLTHAELVAYHSRGFKAVCEYLACLTGIEPDTSIAEWSRRCFLSHDPDVTLKTKILLPVPTAEVVSSFTRTGQDREKFVKWAARMGFKNLPGLDMKMMLEDLGWYIGHDRNGDTEKVHFTCPWSDQHTSPNGTKDTTALRDVPRSGFAWGAKCLHAHCAQRDIRDFLEKAEQTRPGIINRHSASGTDQHSTNDLANAHLFTELFGHNVRFLHDVATWLLWEGGRWRRDTTKGVWKLAGHLPDILRKCADSNEMRRHAVLTGNANRIEGLLKVAKALYPIASQSCEFDTNPFLLGCPNGTLDLRTGKLRAAIPEDMISRQVAVPFAPNAECPRFDKFLREILPDQPDVISYLQRFFGYCLTGDTSEAAFLFFIGHGANGKSTLLNQIHGILGDYSSKSPASLFVTNPRGDDPKAASPELMALEGIRFTFASEPEEGAKLAEAKLKDLTSGEPVSGRKMYGGISTFKPQVKLVISGNHRPRIGGTDYGIWRRLQLVGFHHQFSERERDTSLDGALRKEWPGIFAWMVRGSLQWQRVGLRPPESITGATADYRAEEDLIGAFLRERTRDNPEACVSRPELYREFEVWARASGMKLPPTRHSFNRRLRDRSLKEGKRNGQDYWLGLELIIAPLEES